jgi:hypothetical protein
VFCLGVLLTRFGYAPTRTSSLSLVEVAALPYIKLARCARVSAPQRPEWSPTVRADEPWQLARFESTRSHEAIDHHIWHIIFLPTA